MKKTVLLLGSLFSSGLFGAGLYSEYNTWYYNNGVLYDVAQTAGSQPVLISISQAGFATANLVVSYFSEEACPAASADNKLTINGSEVATTYRCIKTERGRIEHFMVNDATLVNQLVERLNSDFTVVLQQDIKVWAANFKTPKYGLAPRMSFMQ
jgi:hypothetical protein